MGGVHGEGGGQVLLDTIVLWGNRGCLCWRVSVVEAMTDAR